MLLHFIPSFYILIGMLHWYDKHHTCLYVFTTIFVVAVLK